MSAPIHAITMPKWGIEMVEGTINAWAVAVGAYVEKGAPLLEVETEKIVNQVEAPFAGALRRVLAAPGEVKPVGALIGVIAPADIPDSDIERFVASFSAAVVSFEPSANEAGAVPTSQDTAVTAPVVDSESRVSPIARRLAEKLGVDLSRVVGTGRNGRISKEDVEAYAAQNAAAVNSSGTTGASAGTAAAVTSAANEPSRVPMSSMRATIARRLLESSQGIPAYRLTSDVEMSALLALKATLADRSGERITLTDLIVRAVASVLVRHPMVNAQLDGDTILQFAHADIAIAVATDNGLITPIVRMANSKSTAEIARESRDLAARAKAGTLTRDSITGGTFTISNLGMLGVSRFDAIINPPQVAILAIGATELRPRVVEGQIVAGRMCSFTLTCDHRVVDGAVAAPFLQDLRKSIESGSGID
jgi:pyruvate dehydrogenase E2 component (dihydrolipoamide acetyltransferase)